MAAKDRLPLFQTDAIRTIACNAIDEARQSHGFLLFAYIIMPNHMHLLTDQPDKPSDLLRYVKGTIAHRVIEYLKEKDYQSSLEKLRREEWKRRHRYSLWQQEKRGVAPNNRRCSRKVGDLPHIGRHSRKRRPS